MPHVVVRIFSVPAPAGLREREAEVRELMTVVPGFRAYSVIDTGTGVVTIVAGDDKAATDEVGRRMGQFVQANYPEVLRTPPQIIEGEGIFRIEHRVSEQPPHVVVRVFSEPPPKGIEKRQADIREIMMGTPGFRAFSAIDNGSGGVTITACDDKASTDECSRRMREWVQATFPQATPRTPQIIEGEGVFRFTAQAQAAPA